MLHLALTLSLLQPAPTRLVALEEEPPRVKLVDPHQGAARPMEALAGLGGYLLVDAAAVAASYTLERPLRRLRCQSALCSSQGLASVITLTQMLLAPAASALAARLLAREPLAGSLTRGVVYAEVTNALLLVAVTVLGMVQPAVAPLPMVAYLVGAPVAVALVSSYALHSGDGPEPAYAPPPPPADPRFDPPPAGVTLRF